MNVMHLYFKEDFYFETCANVDFCPTLAVTENFLT